VIGVDMKGVFVFRLSNELFSLALSEVKSILFADAIESKIVNRIDEFLLIHTDLDTALNLCNRSSLIIEMGPLINIVNEDDIDEIERTIKDFVHEENTCLFLDSVRGFGKDLLMLLLNAPPYNFKHRLWRKCSQPLKISFINGLAVIYKVLYRRRQQKFECREPQKRPCYRPGTMKPQLARALINLSKASIKSGHVLLDPFCGIGGIVLEACSMGISALCSDLDIRMCLCAKKNIEHFQCSDRVEVLMNDATKIGFKNHVVDAIVTDPPYGIQSIPVGASLTNLIRGFLATASDIIRSRGRAVFAVPIELEVNVDKWLADYGFEIEEKHLNMVHGSLTRVIYVVVKL
jgi:tRNA (guanine10-N2)-dimethyltransferase